MNQEKLTLFFAVYAIELEKVHKNTPESYAWPISELPIVLGRMKVAIEKGSFNKDGAAFKATCKAFGIKHTYTAIKEFLK